VANPINNQVLTWDNINKRWEAKTVADSSATNELQTLSVAANTATLSNSGGSVTIAGAGINTVGTAGTTITVTGTEVDGSVSNELQTLSTGTNTLTLSNGGGTVTVDTDPASDVTGSGTSGQVSFWTGAQTQSGDNGLFWNNTDKRLGIGTNSPGAPLEVRGSGTSSSTWTAQFHNASTGGNNALMIRDDGNVGIGTTTIDNVLTVRRNQDAVTQIQVDNTNNTANAGARFIMGSGATSLVFGRYLSNATSFPTWENRGVFQASSGLSGLIFATSGGDIAFQTGSGVPQRLKIELNGSVKIGTGSADASSILDVTSTAGGILFPRMTTTQRNAISAPADGLMVYNTSDAKFNFRENGAWNTIPNLSGSGSTNRLAIWNSSTNLGFESTFIVDSTNSRLGLGISPSSTFDVVGNVEFQNPSTSYDGGVLGSELLTTGTGAGWTGTSLPVGYTHTDTTNATALVSGFTPANNTIYQVLYTVSGRTKGSITFSFGGYTSGTISTNVTDVNVSQATTGTGPLTITPTANFDGTVKFSIKAITAGSAGFVGRNQAGTVVYEERYSTSNTNIFQGLNAGSRNTTGVNNIFQGYDAGAINTTGSQNIFQGVNAGSRNITGNGNLFQGYNAGRRNTTGSGNVFQGNNAGPVNTTGSGNFFQGSDAGSSNISGSYNLFQGGNAGYNNTTGSGNIFKGANSGFSNTTGSNNIAIGFQAGRYFGTSTGENTAFDNSILIGYQTRPLNINQTNQIVIGYNVTGLGSNTTRIGTGSTIQTHLDGELTIGNTFYDNRVAARIVGANVLSTEYSLVVTNSNGATSTNTNGSLVVTNSGLVGVGTYSPGSRLQINGSGNTNASTALTVQNSDGVSLLRVRDDLYTSINYLRVGNSFSTSTLVFPFVTNSGLPDAAGTNLSFYNYTGANSAVNGAFAFAGNNFTQTSGSHVFFRFGHNFFPTSGNASYSAFTVKPSINQSGGANGITRGFHVDPTLGSAADWRSIEWSNSSGWGLYGAGTAKSYFAGNVAIGTTAQDASSAFEVTSTTQGVLFPRMTTTQRNAIATPADGLVIYNTTDNKLQVRAAGVWVDLH
jgi:hypothetical protein